MTKKAKDPNEPREKKKPKERKSRKGKKDSRPAAGAAPPEPARWSYIDRTRHLAVNLLFIAPFLLIYLLCWWILGDAVQTSAAASLRRGLRLLGTRGLFVLTLCGSLALCGFLLFRLRAARDDAVVFPGMILEGLLYGYALGAAADVMTRFLPVGHWIGLFRPMGLAGATGDVKNLGIAVGAGIFEELIFRGFLCYGLFRALRDVVGTDRYTAGAGSIIVSAAVFSAYHHWGVGGEPWDAVRFTFRFHAGALLGTVFLTRGLGIAAFAHGFYDALVLLSS